MFKIKDLMIKVVPESGVAEELGKGCGMCTDQCTAACTDACSGATAPCEYLSACTCGCTFGDCTDGCTCTQQCTDYCSYPSCGYTCAGGPTKPRKRGGLARPFGSLAELKAELKRQLAAVEAQEKVAEESMKPQTVEEAEALEKKLQEALDEVRDIKSELSKK
jgi:hypothetical protein